MMSKSASKLWAVVPAAGIGSRFCADIPKQFYQLNGQLVAQYTLNRLLSLSMIDRVYVPCDMTSAHWSQVPAVDSGRVRLLGGGENRAQSVFNGLLALQEFADQDDWVLVHDMARPCVTTDSVNQLIDSLSEHPVGGILALPVNDTLKKVSGEKLIVKTVERSQYWVAQTPQMFRFGLLMSAMQAMLQEGLIPTDEASAIEFAGHRPQVVEGRRDNIKITRREDLAVAAAILQNQGVKGCE